jgi:hypothetical protein
MRGSVSGPSCCDRARAEIEDFGTYPEGFLWVLRSQPGKLLYACPFCGADLPTDDDPVTAK